MEAEPETSEQARRPWSGQAARAPRRFSDFDMALGVNPAEGFVPLRL
jgi:hypothetical protein